LIYLDNNATTPMLPEVKDAIGFILEEGFGNPSSVYQIGNQARVALEKSRGIVARALGALPTEITFTGSGTESDNMALFGATFPYFHKGKNMVISNIEHPAVDLTADWLESFGIECRKAPVLIENDMVLKTPFLDMVDDQTVLVSCMLANNETGLLLPVAELFDEFHARGILCHTDAVQAFGKSRVQVADLNCDLLSISAHKIHGPKGVGALYIKRGTPFNALIHGGAQENSRRPGTENVAGIVGLAAAVERIGEKEDHIRGLRDDFESKLVKFFAEKTIIHHKELPRTPNTSSVGFPGKDGNMLLIQLDQKGICASTGSACHSGALSTNSTLLKMGVPEHIAKGTLRFSFSRLSEVSQVNEVIEVLRKIV